MAKKEGNPAIDVAMVELADLGKKFLNAYTHFADMQLGTTTCTRENYEVLFKFLGMDPGEVADMNHVDNNTPLEHCSRQVIASFRELLPPSQLSALVQMLMDVHKSCDDHLDYRYAQSSGHKLNDCGN